MNHLYRWLISGRGLLGAAAFLLVGATTALVYAQTPHETDSSKGHTTAKESPSRSEPEKTTATTQPASAPSEPESGKGKTVGKEGTAKKEPREPQPRREPSPSEILRELTKQSTARRPVVSPVSPGQPDRGVVAEEALPANSIAAPAAKLFPDGYRIVDRLGRLVREGDLWVFSFENRGQGAPELPIRLLPNRLLEDMERFSEGGTKPTIFIISGEITEYHNVNYLLLQKLLTQPDLGNLK